MKSLGRKVLVASFSVLLLLATCGALLALELNRWNAEIAYVMRDYRRAILDSEFHDALIGAVSNSSNYLETGAAADRDEAQAALLRAKEATASLRAVANQDSVALGDVAHANYMSRQERLLGVIESRMGTTIAGGGQPLADSTSQELRSLRGSQTEAEALWQEIIAHHRVERIDNERALQNHSHLVATLGAASAASLLVCLGLVTAYVRQRVVAPLTTLSQLTMFVAAGDLSRRAAVTHSDEIGQLQRSFNRMVVELANQQDQLAELIGNLSRSRDAAEAANRAKTQFLANVSHEVRTPMNGVLITLDLMHESAPGPELRDLADMARVSARSLLGLLNDLLDSTRIESGKLELASVVFEPRRLVDQMLKLHGARATNKGLTIECRVDSRVPAKLRGDPMRLGQILLNLLDNAIKFTESGSIVVSVVVEETRAALPPASGTLERTPVLLLFRVTDSGIGIAPQDAEKIFDPFYQAEGLALRPDGGIGLGLGIARQLARAMAGDLSFESRLGQGSSFWFTARLLAEATDRPAGPAALSASQHQWPVGGTVLLVEDHSTTRDVMARMLERRGLRVVIAANGRDALAFAVAERFDLVLMDCRMPEMDGFQAARAIRQLGDERAGVPIVALTAYALNDRVAASGDAEFDDFVKKPCGVEEIDAVLHRWLVAEPGRRGKKAEITHRERLAPELLLEKAPGA
jgi:signal transduction histidine kinase/CheY-like chemotaxis protein